MERDERYEINSKGSIVVGTPVTLTSSERKTMIEKMFSINGWKYTLVDEITPAHYYIALSKDIHSMILLGAAKKCKMYMGADCAMLCQDILTAKKNL